MEETVVDKQVEVEEQGNSTEGQGQEQAVTGSWYDSIDSDLKNHPSIQKFSDPGKLAKSYVELEKLIGKEKVVIPGEKATKEEWDAFYKKVGRPEDLTGYETPELDIDEQIKMQDSTLESFKQKAHELGLTKKQFAELYGFYHEATQNTFNSALESQVEGKKATETALRSEWGNAYDAKIDGAQKAVNAFFKGKIDKSNEQAFNILANSKGFIQAMSEIASKMGEDIGGTGGSHSTLTPKEAMSEMNSIIMDMNHPYHDNTHPEHNAAVEKVVSLQQLAMASG